MKDEGIKKAIIYWLLPGAGLFLVILILTIRFSVTSRLAETEETEKIIVSSVEFYARRMDQIFNEVTKCISTAATYMNQASDAQTDRQAMLDSVMENAEIYAAVLCDAEGNGVDAWGNEVSLADAFYLSDITGLGERLIYTEDDALTGNPALIVAQMTTKGEYFLCYYDVARLEAAMRKADFGAGAFYLIINRNGHVLHVAGSKDNVYSERTADYYGLLRQNEENANDVKRMQRLITTGLSGITYVTLDADDRALAYAPIGDGDLYLVVGCREWYVNQLINRRWSGMRTMVFQIIVSLLVFFGVVVVMNIIFHIRESEKSRELEDKADSDLLTDLYNKAATERKIKEYLAENPDERALLFVLDVDNFKKINDTMGHAFGDEVLHTLGHRISAEFRASDILGRTGGDEFTLFLRNMKDDAAIQAEAERIVRFFQDFQAGEYVKYSATASIGAAVYPEDAKDFEGLYKAADQALYVAKKRGKNQLAFYGEEPEKDVQS